MIPLVGALALAAPPEDAALTAALVAEMERQLTALTLPEAPPLYHLRYHLTRLDQVDVHASRGALVEVGEDPFSALGVEVRVGSPAFDNTGFGGWQDGIDVTGLPVVLTPESLRIRAWALTDRAYKSAVEQFARKRSQYDRPEDHPGDFVLSGATQFDAAAPQIGATEPLVALARQVSGAMATDPRIERAEVHLGHEAGTRLVVDTEGTRVNQPLQETTVSAVVHVRAADGQLLTDRELWSVRSPADLPPVVEMVRSAGARAAETLALADAPVLDDEYVGPVLFEGEAARDLFRWLLIPQIEGTPDDVPFDTMFGELASEGGDVRVGRRVLPTGWTAVDDPGARPGEASSFTHDQEGTAAQAVPVVVDGVVAEPLMSRIPREEVRSSNGHARGSPGSRLRGRVAQLVVEPDRSRSPNALLRTGLRLAAGYGHDHVLVVRRLQDPSVLDLGEPTFILFGGSSDADSALPPPVAVYRVYADGHEEVLRGAAFSGVHRWLLRDIVAAGPTTEGAFLASPDPGRNTSSPTEGLPSWIAAPDVLVGEVELVPRAPDPRAIPIVPPPPRP